MPNIHFTPSHGRGPKEVPEKGDHGLPENYELPAHAKEARLPKDASEMLTKFKQNAIPGTLKELLQMNPDNLLKLCIALRSTEVSEIPQALAKALKNYAP